MERELRLMKGNEAIAEAAIRYGVDAYFGYPITPQSEILEYLFAEKTEERTGMVTLQSESEVATINMMYGAAGCGKRVMTSSSGPGISLMQEGLSYIAGADLPCLLVNVVRGGPGLGTIQPAQSDYNQSVKGGGHGDYKLITLAPASVQEMSDFVEMGFELAFKYCNPTMILADGIIGQMMEKVYLPPQKNRLTEEEIKKNTPWASLGKPASRKQNVISSLELDPETQELDNQNRFKKYQKLTQEEVRYEMIECDDADFIIVAYGSSARICQKTIEVARQNGDKIGLLRPITLFPYPSKIINQLADKVKGFLAVEMSTGQMVDDVRLAVNGKTKVKHYGRQGGIIPSPDEIYQVVKNKFTEK